MRTVAVASVVVALLCGCETTSVRGTPSATQPAATTFAAASPATPAASMSTPGATTTTASYARASAAPTLTGSAAGTISGHLGAPCECLPPFDIYAITTDGRRFYVTQSVEFQTTYTLVGIAPGDYFVLLTGRRPITTGQRADSERRFGATYSRAVPCGLSVECTDHSLLVVHVSAGSKLAGIDPADFYGAPYDRYPLVPTSGPAQPDLGTPPATFPTAQDAAIFLGRQSTAGRYVASAGECMVNVACFWFTANATGTQAAYYLGAGGSNNDTVLCRFYLTGSGAVWKTFDHRCGGANFPAVGASGRVALGLGETGCVNVHSSPSLSSSVAACLDGGSTVTIDGGPYFAPGSGDDPFKWYWWHIAGKGWMVHTYLRYG
jgi:hypothetical protein